MTPLDILQGAANADPVSAVPQVIAGGGALAGFVWFAVWAINKLSSSHEKVADRFALTVEKSNQQFSETVKAQAEQCEQTTTTLMREQSARQEARENKLIEVLREVRK